VPATRRSRDLASIALGLLATATMPVAIFATRYSEAYELLHAGFAIPLALVLGLGALVAARAARRRNALRLELGGRARGARLGAALGVLGITLASSALVAVCVYGALTYLGER